MDLQHYWVCCPGQGLVRRVCFKVQVSEWDGRSWSLCVYPPWTGGWLRHVLFSDGRSAEEMANLRSSRRDGLRFSSVQSLSRVWLFATPWTAARQACLSITNSRSPPKPMSIELVMPSNHLQLTVLIYKSWLFYLSVLRVGCLKRAIIEK